MKNEADFFQRTYEICRQIPFGRVTSYGAIAKAIGAPKAARMVGWAMNKSFTIIPQVPAHHVVNRNGILSGKKFFGTPTMMQQLLEEEGIMVENDQVVEFDRLFWNPLSLSEF